MGLVLPSVRVDCVVPVKGSLPVKDSGNDDGSRGVASEISTDWMKTTWQVSGFPTDLSAYSSCSVMES